MNEDTKNFSALVLRQRLMPEEQLEECIAYQESMSTHGLQKPVWVIALEKGFLKQENYRDVVQSVRWIGIRQEDRRFAETASGMGLAGLTEVESALFAQEQAFKTGKKIRRIKDILSERGILDPGKIARIEAAVAAAHDNAAPEPPSPGAPLQSTPTLDEEGVVPVEQVNTMDDLIFPAEPAAAAKQIEKPAPVPAPEEGMPALPDLDDADTLGPRPQPDQDAPTIVKKKPARPRPSETKGGRDEVTVVGQVLSGDPGEEPTVVGKIATDSGRAAAKARPAKPRTVIHKAAESTGEAAEEEADLEKTVISAAPEGDSGDASEDKKTRTLSRTGSRAGKTGRKKKGASEEAAESPEAAAVAAPKKGPPVVLIAGAAGGFGCLLLVVLLVVLVVLPMLSGGGGSNDTGGSSDSTAGETDDSTGGGESDETGENKADPQDKQPGPDDPSSTKQPDLPDTTPKPPSDEEKAGPMLEDAIAKRESGRFADAAAALDEILSKYRPTEAGKKAAELVETVKKEEQCDRVLGEAANSLENGDLAAAQESLEEARKLGVLADRVSELSASVSREKEFAEMVDRGRSLMESSKYSEAAETFARALDVFDRPQVRKLMAESRSRDFAERAGKEASAGRLDEALALLEQAKAALEAEGVDVPENMLSSLSDIRQRAGKKARAALVSRAKALIRKGDKETAASEIEDHIRKYGSDKELDELLASARPKPVRPDPTPPGPGPAGDNETVNAADGSVMVLIPEGEFTMGSSNGDRDQQPQHKVRMSAFRISKHEITNAQFARFLEAFGSDRDESRNRLVYESSLGLRKSGGKWVPSAGMENHPVVGVTWFGASAYCRWAGGELPTEAQWEKAARGEKGARYPWGQDRPGQNLAVYGPSAARSEKVGSRPAGASPYGVLDMAGNVWEWCRDAYSQDFYSKSPDSDPFNDGAPSIKRVLRGGSYKFSDRFLDPCNRIAHSPSDSNDYFGFRMVIQG